ncbi:MAG: VOC family protein [Microthrixaceae bacterium]
MPPIVVNLWFSTKALEAAVFPDARLGRVTHHGPAGPLPEGSVLTVEFDLGAQRFVALNGGPHHEFNDAVSLAMDCADQAEVDHYWEALGAGGQHLRCGWLIDRYGLRWQVVPRELTDLLALPDPEARSRVQAALMQMEKLDVATLRAAAESPDRSAS